MKLVWTYVRERFGIVRFGSLAALLALASYDVPGLPTRANWLSEWGARTALALCLVFTFRLRDDLASRQVDAANHPNRTLVRVDKLGPVWTTLAISVAVSAGLLAFWGGWEHLAGFGLLLGAFELFYRVFKPRVQFGWSHLLYLAKYPAFVWLIGLGASGHGSVRSISMVAVYLAFCVFELLDNRALGVLRWARWGIVVELGALGALVVWAVREQGPVTTTWGWAGLAVWCVLVVRLLWSELGVGAAHSRIQVQMAPTVFLVCALLIVAMIRTRLPGSIW